MGSFNERCMVTGVCLYDCTIVLLAEQSDQRYRPCALPFDGSWDSYGSIDMLREDPHLRSLAATLKAALRSGALTSNFEAWRDPITDADDASTVINKFVGLLWVDSADNASNATLSGKRVRAAMISKPVANHLAVTNHASEDLRLEALLDWPDTAAIFYADCDRATLLTHSLRLRSLDEALTQRAIPWAPVGPTGTQFGGREERQAVHQACKRYQQDLSVRSALLEYARWHYDGDLTLEDLLEPEWIDWAD